VALSQTLVHYSVWPSRSTAHINCYYGVYTDHTSRNVNLVFVRDLRNQCMTKCHPFYALLRTAPRCITRWLDVCRRSCCTHPKPRDYKVTLIKLPYCRINRHHIQTGELELNAAIYEQAVSVSQTLTVPKHVRAVFHMIEARSLVYITHYLAAGSTQSVQKMFCKNSGADVAVQIVRHKQSISMLKMTASWNMAPCSLTEEDQRFRCP
jgi:hypothetical protein